MADPDHPPLPRVDRDWQPETVAWWARVASEPVASLFLAADWSTLQLVVVLVDDFWAAETPQLRRELSVEIRLQCRRFGLTPQDRGLLGWSTAAIRCGWCSRLFVPLRRDQRYCCDSHRAAASRRRRRGR